MTLACTSYLTSLHTDRAEISPPFISTEQEQLRYLCPVRAPRIQLQKNLISFLCLSKQWLSQWILVAIAVAYTSRGLQPPAGLQTLYWRFGIIVGCLHSVQQLADLSFAGFYSLDVTAASLADSLLSVGATDGDLFPITGLWSDPGVSISQSETLTHAT